MPNTSESLIGKWFTYPRQSVSTRDPSLVASTKQNVRRSSSRQRPVGVLAQTSRSASEEIPSGSSPNQNWRLSWAFEEVFLVSQRAMTCQLETLRRESPLSSTDKDLRNLLFAWPDLGYAFFHRKPLKPESPHVDQTRWQNCLRM